jgi:hypothetical protein
VRNDEVAIPYSGAARRARLSLSHRDSRESASSHYIEAALSLENKRFQKINKNKNES